MLIEFGDGGFTGTDRINVSGGLGGSGSSNGAPGDPGVVIFAPVPEPETYALMLAGLAAVGFMARRARRRA